MTANKTPSHHPRFADSQPPNPFADFKRPNPFAEAMPARASEMLEESQSAATWGPYSTIETIDDGEGEIVGEHALEVLITWGSSVLHVAHLSPPRAFVVGDETDGSGEPVDFHLPENILGRRRLPLIAMEDGSPHVILPDIAQGSLELDKQKLDLRSVMDEAAQCLTVTRAKQHLLQEKARVKMQLGEVEFFVRLVPKSAPIERGLLSNIDSAVPGYFGATAGIAAAFMLSMAYFVPPIGLTDQSEIDKERLMDIGHYLDQLAEKDRKKQQSQEQDAGGPEEGKEAAKADHAEGKAGKDNGPKEPKRVAVKGPIDNNTMKLSRHEAIKEAANFGMIGILNNGIAADPNAPKSMFGGDISEGFNDISANGNLWADSIGEAGGSGGLGLSGIGQGGGYGRGLGFGIGNIGEGIGSGRGKHGMGFDRGIGTGTHVAKAPAVLTVGKTVVGGRLPPQVVQRIVRQNFGRFRMCYTQGLARNPSLEGRIPVRFVIGRDGAVSNVAAMGSFPDSQVQSCVQSAFYGLSFPQPENGIVQVTYPLIFSPS